MTITSGRTTIGTTPTLIDGLGVNPFRLHVHNSDNATNIFLGDENVTTTTGLELLAKDSIELVINPLEALYAVSSQANHVLSWLKQSE
jgi:hypothetical protein